MWKHGYMVVIGAVCVVVGSGLLWLYPMAVWQRWVGIILMIVGTNFYMEYGRKRECDKWREIIKQIRNTGNELNQA